MILRERSHLRNLALAGLAAALLIGTPAVARADHEHRGHRKHSHSRYHDHSRCGHRSHFIRSDLNRHRGHWHGRYHRARARRHHWHHQRHHQRVASIDRFLVRALLGGAIVLHYE